MISKRTIRLVLVAFIALLLLYAVYYSATHGRLVINNRGDNKLTIVQIHDNGELGETVDVSNGAFIHSGEYAVKNSQNDLIRIAHAKIGRWFQTTSVTYADTKTAQTSRIAALTYEHLLPADDGSVVSYTDLPGYTSGYTVHPPR